MGVGPSPPPMKRKKKKKKRESSEGGNRYTQGKGKNGEGSGLLPRISTNVVVK
jgi:hypothetical protein